MNYSIIVEEKQKNIFNYNLSLNKFQRTLKSHESEGIPINNNDSFVKSYIFTKTVCNVTGVNNSLKTLILKEEKQYTILSQTSSLTWFRLHEFLANQISVECYEVKWT